MQWSEAMADLQEQVHLEDETIEMNLDQRAVFQKDNSEGKTSGPPVDQMDAFQHYACLYIKYLQIFRSLDAAFDNLVHPQKRIDLRLVVDSVMARVVELKHILVYWNNTGGDNGRNPDVKQDQPFAWEYVHMDDLLVDLKLPPKTLEVPVPTYFVEQREEQHNRRDRLIEGYSNLKLGVAKIAIEEDPFADEGGDGDFSLEEAIEILQRNERGRQGRQRAILVQELREEEKQRRLYESKEHEEMDPELAATQLQRVYRGYLSRREAERDRDAELVFIGMRPSENTRIKELENELARARLKRKDEQKENRVEFDDALVGQHDIVRDEEGPLMKDEMMNERREWFTKELAQGSDFPEDLTGFYLMKNPPPVVEEAEEGGKGGKDKKKDKKDDKKKDKKGKGEVEEVLEMPPPLTGPSQLTMLMHASIKSKWKRWKGTMVCVLFCFCM